MDFSSQNLKYNVKHLDNRAVVFFSGLSQTEADYAGTNRQQVNIYTSVSS